MKNSNFEPVMKKPSHKRSATENVGVGDFGSAFVISGVGFVTRDVPPTSRKAHIDISEHSKAQVLEFAPNGGMLATGHQDKTIKFWDCDFNLSEKYSLSVSSEVTQIAFSQRRGKMATSDNLNQLNIYAMWPPMRENQIYNKGRINGFCFAKSRE